LGRTAEARAAYESSLQITRRLAAEEPDDLKRQRDLSVALDRLGDLCLQEGEPEKALENYEAGMVIARRIAEKDVASAAAQFDLTAGLAKQGDTLLALGRMEEAENAYREALVIARQLADADPLNTIFSRTVSVTLCKVGCVELLCEETQEAIRSFEAAIDVAARLAAADPASIQFQRDLAVCYNRAMLGYQEAGDLTHWRDASRQAIDGFTRVFEATAGDDVSARDLANALRHACEGLLVFSDVLPDDQAVALARAQQLVSLSPVGDVRALQLLALFQFMSGDVNQAVATQEKAIAALPDDPQSADQRAKLTKELDDYRAAVSSAPDDADKDEKSPPPDASES